MPDPADVALEAIYASLPNIDCQGLCHDECTALYMSNREAQRAALAGVELPPPGVAKPAMLADDDWRCPALSADHRCTIYDARPLICRLYGLAGDELSCPHGCRPSALPLTQAEVVALVTRASEVGGGLYS
jgi:Fe-S-cluster containining protein